MFAATLPAETWAFMIVLVRVAAFFSLAPALGEATIPTNVRLLSALGIAFLAAPTVAAGLPPLPSSPLVMALAIAGEIAAGLVMAMALRLVFSGLHVAGTLVGLQSGMAFAMAYDPSQGQQSVLFSNFLSLAGIVLVFVSDLHLVALRALVDSYVLFPPGGLPPVRDFATIATDFAADGFRLGVEMASPFILFGVLFNLGLGVLNRLMPAMQVFFIAMPAQILLNLLLLAAAVGICLDAFAERFALALGRFLA